MTQLEKRLIVAMDLGITIQHMDGHRYVLCTDYERDFMANAARAGCSFYGKVYGSLVDALDLIDFVRARMGQKSLEETFDNNCAVDGGPFRDGGTYCPGNITDRYETDVGRERAVTNRPVFDPHYLKE